MSKGATGPLERLQKILSAAGVASRRASEALIVDGRVTINGTVVTTLGTKADPASDEIRVDGRRIGPVPVHRYILLNKPRGYVTTRHDPQQRPTVMDLMKGIREYLYPVGRLDYDSEGLLLLTNDGELAARLMHPRHEVERVYHARVRGRPDRHALDRLSAGVTLDGRRTAPARVRLLERPDSIGADQATIEMALHEGRHRQVRRMLEAIGHPVVRLRRVRIGPIEDPDIPPGHWRELTDREVRKLRKGVGLTPGDETVSAPSRPARRRPSPR